jgi:hypothetical protein
VLIVLHLRKALAIKLAITVTFIVTLIPTDVAPLISLCGNCAWLWIKLDN